MDNLKQRYENIKFWRKRNVVSAVFAINGILTMLTPGLLNWLIKSVFRKFGNLGLLVAFVLYYIGPWAGTWYFFLGLSAISELEVRCEKCNNKFTLEELESMGETFRCPYCLHDKIKQPPSKTEDINTKVERMLRIIYRITNSK